VTDAPPSMGMDPARFQQRKTVVIVDDSPLLRRWLRMVLEGNRRLVVVGEASDAREAGAVIQATRPDVITLDIQMPGMNGLEFLEKLMHRNPLPVVVFSGVTRANCETTVRALMLGAVDCLEKPENGTSQRLRDTISRRVFAAACSRIQTAPRARAASTSAPAVRHQGMEPLVLIGASTGGVAALDTLIGGLDPAGPPVVIVQHMPGIHLVSFSQLLDRRFDQHVLLARPGMALAPGQIVLAPALGQHTHVTRSLGQWEIRLQSDDEGAGHCPSINQLFHSAVPHARDVIATILTGLGQDGARGLKALRDAGATTFGQDKDSSTVYGMPRAAWEIGAVERQYPLAEMSQALNQAAARHRARLVRARQ
jgi:Chemotaxis response regulator containing a CheY-like receiver domain and a methylesterase domain